MGEEVKEVGSKKGMELRSGGAAKVGSTLRIQELNGMLHANRPSVDIHRTRCFTKVFKATENEPFIRRRYKAVAETYRTLQPIIHDHERLAGWQAKKVRGVQIAIEMHAHWLAEDLEQMRTRQFDPFECDDADMAELRDEHIPYWKDKTLSSVWSKMVPNAEKMTGCGVADVVNYVTSNGSHFLPDYPKLLEIGLKGYYELAQDCLANLDPNNPEDLGKRDFYEGICEVLLAIKTLAQNYANKAWEKAAAETSPKRKAELTKMAETMEWVPWNPPRDFYEAIEDVWLMFMFLFTEGAGPSVTYSRFDQYMLPFYQKDIAEGKLTPEEAMEYIEELYIKTTNIPWFQSTQLAYIFGGYYRYPHMDVGGLTKYGRDATNELSYLCLKAMRFVRTTSPAISIMLHQKTPDSLLLEACKLSAEGMGHPSFFNVDTLNAMLEYRGSGLEGKSPYTKEQILELGSPIGCVEPGVIGHQFGHTDSGIINLAACAGLAMTDGVKPEGVFGWGCGQQVGPKTGDPRTFRSYEEFHAAVKTQIEAAVKEAHQYLIVAEKLISEQHQLPMFSVLSRGCIEKGIDVTAGGAYCNVGPTIQSLGFADCVNSMAAVKKVVFEDRAATMDEVCKALDTNFSGCEKLRAMLKRAPKYGNDDDYVDNIAADIWQYFAEVVRSLKNYRGCFADPAVQMVQANVGFGTMTGALPNGRLAGEPVADTMSAEHQTDVNGPTAAARTYGKLNYPAYTNGTLLNMWISRSELIN